MNKNLIDLKINFDTFIQNQNLKELNLINFLNTNLNCVFKKLKNNIPFEIIEFVFFILKYIKLIVFFKVIKRIK